MVAQDAVNKTILCHLLGLTPADIWAVKQGNGGVTVVDMPSEPGQPAVACLNSPPTWVVFSIAQPLERLKSQN